METPKTLIEAVRYFTNLDACNTLMISLKWPDGRIVCPKCGSDKIGEIKTRRMLRCNAPECRKQFSAKVGTIFEDSPLGLDKWFVCVWSIANAKNGISSCEVARALGVTQKTAWFMLHRIRTAMNTQSFKKMDGEVESDETFIGGKAANMHASRRAEVIQGRGGECVRNSADDERGKPWIRFVCRSSANAAAACSTDMSSGACTAFVKNAHRE